MYVPFSEFSGTVTRCLSQLNHVDTDTEPSRPSGELRLGIVPNW
jgi:hypothetical protein